jgi:hypothetical protein
MFERPETITLSGEEFPIKCDMVVLEKIQDKYGSVLAFERLIYTFVPKLDKDGNPIVNEEGMMVGNVVTPADLKPLFDALLWMVDEGCEIMKELGESVPEYTPERLKRMVDMPPYQLSDVLHDEYTRCFERKN